MSQWGGRVGRRSAWAPAGLVVAASGGAFCAARGVKCVPIRDRRTDSPAEGRPAGTRLSCVAMREPHHDRARAESFGSVAAQYDSYRPTHSDALLDDLAALGPAQVHDVGRQFDLLTFGAAWHWIDPALGITKAARVVRRGGTVARFWNYEVPDEPVASALETVYGRLAPEATRYAPSPLGDWADPLAESDAFPSSETMTYEWRCTLSADEWVGMVATFSDHQRLGPERLTALQQALGAAIETLGGTVHARGRHGGIPGMPLVQP